MPLEDYFVTEDAFVSLNHPLGHQDQLGKITSAIPTCKAILHSALHSRSEAFASQHVGGGMTVESKTYLAGLGSAEAPLQASKRP